MLPDLLANKNLSISLSKDFRSKLAAIVGEKGVPESPLIAVSLMHSSFANEHGSAFSNVDIPITTILEWLRHLGASYLELVLHHIVFDDRNTFTVGEINKLVAAYKNDVFKIFDDYFGIVESASFGKGQANNSNTPNMQRPLTLQFLGALRICSNYSLLYSLVDSLIKKGNVNFNQGISYKTELMIYSQSMKLGHPLYELVKMSGPEHAKQFTIRAFTIDGRSQEGDGLSKKQAEESAARKYLEQFAQIYLTPHSHIRKSIVPTKTCHLCLGQHKQEIDYLSKILQIPSEKSWLLSQALVHSSYTNESIQKGLLDNSTLAQLGSQVLDAIGSDMIYGTLVKYQLSALEGFPFKQTLGDFEMPETVSQGFDLLNLQNALLIGKGQTSVGINISMKADCYQAVVAALFITFGTTDQPELIVHNSLIDLLKENTINGISDPDKVKDDKSLLQELLQALYFDWHYESIQSGPGHMSEFVSTIEIHSNQTNENLRLTISKKMKTIKEADKVIAHATYRMIEKINSKKISPPNAELNSNAVTKKCARFFLRHEFASVPLTYSEDRKWSEYGLLGSSFFLSDKPFDFIRWLRLNEDLLGDEKGLISNQEKVIGYFERLQKSIKIGKENKLSKQIDEANEYINSIDLDKYDMAFQVSSEFSKILALSTIFKLEYQGYQSTKIGNILDDFFTLRRNRGPKIQLIGEIPDITVFINFNMHQTMLDETISILTSFASNNKPICISVSFNPNEMYLHYVFTISENIDSNDLNNRLESNYLWQFLFQSMPIKDILIKEQSLEFSCFAFSVLSQDSFLAKAFSIYYRKGLSKTEIEEIGRILHDLKNNMVACKIALESGSEGTTQKLKAKYEASLHLDSAKSLVQMARSISKATEKPTISSVSLGDFFRHYIAEKMTSLPYNIRIIPPNNRGNNQFWTSNIFLLSIIENLVKNSVESMPEGGEIKIDWLYDESEKRCLIEIIDSGIGMKQELLNKLIAGESVQSGKVFGSGIGMLTVKSMLQRIWGELSATSDVNSGTHWTIELPSLEKYQDSDVGSNKVANPVTSTVEEINLT